MVLLALTLFLYDLLNGPLFLFVFALINLAGLALSSILLIRAKMRFRLLPWGAFLLVTALTVPFARPIEGKIQANLGGKIVRTEPLSLRNGKVVGTYSRDRQVEIYAGVPYAEAPIGERRWKEPVPKQDWEGIKDCAYFAPKSMQAKSNPIMSTLVDMYAEKSWHPDYRMNVEERRSEDSLYFNIWRPAENSGNLPILVYIHGGSLTSGSSSYVHYNGEAMARKGVIMITIAYRLGIFGYFAHPDLIAESPNATTGNYGLLDQIEALRFIKENAPYFGGDPSNITIAGESAGSSSVSALCASPLASGLFQKAIGESSSIAGRYPPHTFRSLETALEMGRDIQKEFHCEDLSELRSLSAEKLLSTRYANSAMTIDGYALPKTPYEVYKEGNNNETALLNGYNVKESDAFVVPNFLFSPTNGKNIASRLASYFDEQAADEFMEAYKEEIQADAFSAFNAIISAYWFMQPHYEWSTLASDNGIPVYRYQFTKENGYYGTYHAGELPYAYGNLDKGHAFAYSKSDYALSETMLSYWSNFAKNGNPNGGDMPTWDAWDEASDPLMELGVHVGPIEEKAKKAYPIIAAYSQRKNAAE